MKLKKLVPMIACFSLFGQTRAADLKLASTQIIHIGNSAEPREIDPGKMTGTPEAHIADNLFEGLTTLNPVTLAPEPGIAESWTVSKDGLTYTFNIRKNAKWSDGKPLTANDFVFAWRRALSKDLASEYAYQLFYLKNGAKYNSGDLKDPAQVGVKAVDATTLHVALEKPTPYFLSLCAFHTLYPVPEHIVAANKGEDWTRPGKIASNGAYMLTEWKLNQHIKLVPNPYYWNAGLVKIKEVYFYPIENHETEERNFAAGKLDMTDEVPVLKIPVYKEQIKTAGGATSPFRIDPYLGVYFYRLNTTQKPLNDIRVRRALSLAIDRQSLVDNVSRAGEQPSLGFTPTGMGAYVGPTGLPTSINATQIAEAKKLLAEAGYPEGKGMPKIEIMFNTHDKHRKLALAIQQMWKKNLNIEVTLANQEWKVYLNNQTKMDYQVSRSGWIGDYPDPTTFLDLFVTDGGNNKTGWSNKEYDRLIAAAASERNEQKRFALLHDAEKILLAELPVIPIYLYTLPRLISKKVNTQTNDGKLIPYASNIQDRRYVKNMVITQ